MKKNKVSRKITGLGWCFLILFSSCGSYDLLLLNGEVHDGMGSDPVTRDIGIRKGRIKKIAASIKGKAKRTIELGGLQVSPGFIDMHAHVEPLPLYPDAKSHIMQGVTTALGGPDGGSPFPIGSFLDSLDHTGVGLNVAYLIGHNTVRNHVMGLQDRKPISSELQAMKIHIDQAMQQGAFGISTGLKYLPGTFAETEEIIELSKEAAKYGGIYTSHLRDEGLGLLKSVEEAIEIGRQAGMRVILTHHKAIGQPMWGASTKTLALVDRARSNGLDIRMDQYPYTASHTGISVMIPSWALEGGQTKFEERCSDATTRDSIKTGIIHNMINDRGGNDLRRVQFSKLNWKPEFEGKTLRDFVEAEGLDPTIENGAEMIIEIQLHRGAHCIYHVIDSTDVVRIMKHPFTMIASDGRLTQIGQGHPHPRAYGTFPRVLGYYCRNLGVLDLPEAIRKMTSLPAESLGLDDRGTIKINNWADLTIFDAETIIDRSTFESPHQFPDGIHYVIINGKFAVDQGVFTNTLNGKVLRKGQHSTTN